MVGVVEDGDIEPHRVDVGLVDRDAKRYEVIVANEHAAAKLVDLLVGQNLVEPDAILLLELVVDHMLRRLQSRIVRDDHQTGDRARQPPERKAPCRLGGEEGIERLVPLFAEHVPGLVVDIVRELARKLDRHLVDRHTLLAKVDFVVDRHDDAGVDPHASRLDILYRERRGHIARLGQNLGQSDTRKALMKEDPRLLFLYELSPAAVAAAAREHLLLARLLRLARFPTVTWTEPAVAASASIVAIESASSPAAAVVRCPREESSSWH
jgi:hypothetical protein